MVPSVASEKKSPVTPPGIDPETFRLLVQWIYGATSVYSKNEVYSLGDILLNTWQRKYYNRNKVCVNKFVQVLHHLYSDIMRHKQRYCYCHTENNKQI
jgi:hypothetical protein